MSVSDNTSHFKDQITGSMKWLSKQKKTVFIGEGIINAGRIYGTCNSISMKKCIETPIAENLIAGAAIGLALQGYVPVVIFQRMDFMLIASDAIINHMALIPRMSGGKIALAIIIRAIIGSQDKSFDVGPQHNHDFTHIFKPYITTVSLRPKMDVLDTYKEAYRAGHPVLLIERKDDYDKEVQKGM